MQFPSLVARTFHGEGIVIKVDTSAQTVTIAHRPIAQYMAAMTMPFRAERLTELNGLNPGDRVSFDLKVGSKTTVVRNIRRIPNRTDIPIPRPSNQVSTGALIPDFTLRDQESRLVHLSDFRGRVIAVNFLYTRCPLPDVCPRLAANFAALQRHLRSKMGTEIVLLSITIDPKYDTPEVLAGYARRWQADNESWRFLTGEVEEVQRIAGLFGLAYWPENDSLTHTSVTAIISRDGHLAAIVEGTNYRVDQLIQLVEHQLGAPH